MTKEDIVMAVASRSRLPKAKIATALDVFLGAVTEALARHERVEIRRFGTFEVTHRRARVARDLNARQEIRLPGRSMPRFIPFDAFKDRVAKQYETADASNGPARVGVLPAVSPDAVSAPGAAPAGAPPGRPRLAVLEQRVQEHPDDIDARMALSAAYAEQDRYEEAMAQCQAVLRLDAHHLGAINQLGEILVRIGAHERAHEEFDRALHLAPDHIDTLMNRGRLRSQKGRYTEAEQDFKRVLELDPANAQACLQTGILYARRGLYIRAIQEFEQALTHDPASAEAYFQLGKTYDHLERYDEAIRMFEDLARLYPEHQRVYWHLGMLYDKKKMGDKALEMYQRSNRLSTTKKGNDQP
jgi:tetratricopeptide (TPR) repeat protein